MIKVKWTKEFTSGYLKGVMYDSELSMANLETANEYMKFLHAHKTVPVDSSDSESYICHLARIVTE